MILRMLKKNNIMKTFFSNKIIGFLLSVMLFLPMLAFAQDFSHDLSISEADISVPGSILKGQEVLIYATVHNNAEVDLMGVVKFYDERDGQFINSDQSISVIAGKTDDVFVPFSSNVIGEHKIAVRVVPWNGDNDDPSNK